jgi:hypothetical protein
MVVDETRGYPKIDTEVPSSAVTSPNTLDWLRHRFSPPIQDVARPSCEPLQPFSSM